MTVCQTRVQRDGPGELIIGPGVQLTVSSDGHAELAGLTLNPAAPNANSCAELIGLDAGPTKLTTIENAPEEWRAQFTNLLLAKGRALIRAASPPVR